MATKVLEKCWIAPAPPVSVSLPLTLFDVGWLNAGPVEQIFLYSFADPIDIPNLKSSLALTLHHFFPFVGRVHLIPGSTNRHEIHVSNADSVSFTVAETNIDFNNCISIGPKSSSTSKALVPQLQNGTLLAVQVTIFPGHGLCIGLSVSHVAGDGLTAGQFVKSWASSSKSNVEIPSMLFDRSLITDPCDLYSEYFNDLLSFKVKKDEEVPVVNRENLVHSSFKLSRDDVDALKTLIGGRTSCFVATCAYVSVCLVKARGYEPGEFFNFAFMVDMRRRMDPVIPETYFGNCVGCCFAEVKVAELIGKNGIVTAAEALASAIGRMKEGLEKSMKGMIRKAMKVMSLTSKGAMSVAGSPTIGFYEVDFGWGRPTKVEIPSIGSTGAISMSESGDECGGVEIGIVLPKQEMDALVTIFENGLKF